MRCFKVIVLWLVFSTSCIAQQYVFSGGYGYSMYLCNTQTIQSWGDNSYGQLARTNDDISFIRPCKIPNVSNIISVDAGLGSFCCALTSDGYVLSWGHNFYGELGIGASCPGICEAFSPDTVLGGETGTKFLEHVTAISVGQTHAYALLETGEVVAWGNNYYGQLGNGQTISETTPVYVKINATERLSNIAMISAGGNHGFALTNNGEALAWGDNQADQLGCGDSEIHEYPVPIVDNSGTPLSDIQSIDAGLFFGLLLQNNGYVYGTGAYKGTHNDQSGIHYKTLNYAERVIGGETPNNYLENVYAISAGFSHALAITIEKGKKYVVSWGDNRFPNLYQTSGGQLGNNSQTKQAYAPVYMKTSTSERLQNAEKINAGCGVSYVATFNDFNQEVQFFVCGRNADGQLGFGDRVDRYAATRLSAIGTLYGYPDYDGPKYHVTGKVVSASKPIENCYTYLFEESKELPVDSCLTDENGTFSFLTKPCTATILAKSPSILYCNTWAGNKTSQDDATRFLIDAPIKNIVITLIQTPTSIQDITSQPLWQQGSLVSVYNLQGKLLRQFVVSTNSNAVLQSYSEPIVVVLQNKRQKKSFFYYKENL